jgi:branched-chain amino acid transport system substrate-binding protein
MIGNIGSYTGANDENGAGAGQLVQAWASSINASGGLNGHPVKVVVLDDAGSPSKALQDANQLVADHVVAVVGEDSIIPTSWTSVMDKAGIPLIGGIPSDPFNYTDTNAFPIGLSAVPQIAGELEYMKSQGLTKFGMLYCAEAPICASLGPASKAVAGIVGGVTVPYVGEVAATSPTYTSQCEAMQSAGVQAVEVASVPSVPIRVAAACAQLGVKPKQINASETSDAAWLTTPSLDGAVLISPVADYTDSSLPAVAQFLSVGSQYISGLQKNPQFGQHALLGWAAAQVFEAAAKAGNLGPTSTSQDVKTALYTLKGFDAGGIMPAVTYTQGQPTFVSCYFTYQESSGAWKPLNNDQSTCLPAATVTALQGMLKAAG